MRLRLLINLRPANDATAPCTQSALQVSNTAPEHYNHADMVRKQSRPKPNSDYPPKAVAFVLAFHTGGGPSSKKSTTSKISGLLCLPLLLQSRNNQLIYRLTCPPTDKQRSFRTTKLPPDHHHANLTTHQSSHSPIHSPIHISEHTKSFGIICIDNDIDKDD